MGIIHHYCVEKDLAICVIDQTMVKRQQTQLVAFLGNQTDPILVVKSPTEGEHEVLLANESGKSVFKLNSSTKIGEHRVKVVASNDEEGS